MERRRFLSTLGIIGEAVRIGIRNPSFILLGTIVSLPLFCITLLYDGLVQMQSSVSPLSLDPPPNSDPVTKFTHLMSGSGWFLQLGLLYFIPMEFLNLLIVVTTVYSASAIHVRARPLGVGDMLCNSIVKTRWKGPMATYIFTSLLSNTFLIFIGLFIVLGPLLESGDVFLLLVSMVVVIIAYGIWLVLTAWLDMSVVVSILEEKGGLQSLSTSQYLSKGNNRVRGFLLMLFDFILLYGVSFLALIVSGDFSRRIVYYVVYTGLECVRKVLKWVVVMVYYHDCKRRCRGKIDIEDCREDELLCRDFSSR